MKEQIGMLCNNIGFLLMGVDGVEVFGFGIIVGLKFGIFVFFFFEVMWCFFEKIRLQKIEYFIEKVNYKMRWEV